MTGATINGPSCFPVPSRRCTLAGLPFVGDRTDSAPIERLFCTALASLSPSRGNLRVVGGPGALRIAGAATAIPAPARRSPAPR